jgi:surfeit locus 1 family protein
VTRTYRRLLVPGLSTFVMLLVLLGLGTWQVYRLHWKEGILAQIAIAEVAPAAPLAEEPRPYTKVSVTGRYRYDLAVTYGAEVRDTQAGPTMGSYQVVPLERDNGGVVLVERGWVPQKREQKLDDPAGEVAVTGYVRPGETQHWFSAADDVAGRSFFTLDPQAIGAAVGVPNPAPFTLVAMGPAVAGIYPAPAQHLPRPPNNHLAYVITWYGLAAALIVIFGVWVRKALRS